MTATRVDWSSVLTLLILRGSLLLSCCRAAASPPLPSFVNTPISPTKTVSSVYVQDHWSEVVTLPRPDVSRTDFNNSQRVNCSYAAQGLLQWSSPNTWPGLSVPVANPSVPITIPSGASVLVSSGVLSSSIYGYITIPSGSSLIFADANITLHTMGIEVAGSLVIGTETCPLSSYVNIVLHGNRPSSLPVAPVIKGIHVTGTLDMHGAIYAPSWTRLARTASAGDTLIYLQDIVNWEPGQTIMITTTNVKDSLDFNRNDLATIASLYTAPNLGRHVSVIKLTAALKWDHFANTEYQAEVAMLSRRLVIMGDSNSTDTQSGSAVCTDTSSTSTHPCYFPSGYGGHVMIDTTGVGRITAVEFYHMGQTNVMARYPFHLHMLGDGAANSWIRYSSIHSSFYRCVSVHGSSYSLISNNVAYDITGNCFYLEDGVEENNVFEYNLGAFIHPMAMTNQDKFWSQFLDWTSASTALLVPTDLTASAFYITNAYNTFVGNAASGGWSGFSFPGLPKPILLHRNVAMTPPMARPLKLFDGNSAHSTGYWWSNGGAFYIGGYFEHDSSSNDVLHYNPGRIIAGRDTCNQALQPWGCQISDFSWMRFTNTKAFLANRGVMHWGARVEMIKYEGHDCGKSANVFGTVWIDQMLTVCRTRNIPKFLNNCPTTKSWWDCAPRDYTYWLTYLGFEWYDVGQKHIVTNVTFRDCHSKWSQCLNGECTAAPWSLLSHSDQFVPEVMQATAKVMYQNCDTTRLWQYATRDKGITVSGRSQNWRDVDGSTSLRNVPTHMGSSWALDWWKLSNSSCVAAPGNMDMWECDAPTATASITVTADDSLAAAVGDTLCSNGLGLPCPTIGYANHMYRPSLKSNGLVLTANPKLTGIVDNKLGGGWYIRYLSGAPKTLTISNIQLMNYDGTPGASMILAIPYPAGSTFTVTGMAASWCWPSQWTLCSHQYQQMSSLTDLRARTAADGYFFDPAINVLYVQVVQQNEDSLGAGFWDPFQAPKLSFTRKGITLLAPSAFQIVIQSSCTASVNNSRFCALDNKDFDVVRTAFIPRASPTSLPSKLTSVPGSALVSKSSRPVTSTTSSSVPSARSSIVYASTSLSPTSPPPSTYTHPPNSTVIREQTVNTSNANVASSSTSAVVATAAVCSVVAVSSLVAFTVSRMRKRHRQSRAGQMPTSAAQQ